MRTHAFSLAVAGLLTFARATHAAPPTNVTTCGTVITQSGNYVLANDLIDCVGAGITINASNVHLKLDQRAIQGAAGTAGIAVSPGKSKVKIQGPGLITGFSVGISFLGVDDSSVQNVTATGNAFGIGVNSQDSDLSEHDRFIGNDLTNNLGHGITVNGGSDLLIVANDASDNGGRGIYLFRGTGNKVQENTADRNGVVGISIEGPASTGHTIQGNSAFGNGAIDMLDGNPDCDDNVWVDNAFATAAPANCIH